MHGVITGLFLGCYIFSLCSTMATGSENMCLRKALSYQGLWVG